MAELNLGNLYDFNKNAMSQIEPMDMIRLNLMLNSVADTMIDACEACDHHYWMLLCHERRDYTMFNIIEATELEYIIRELRPTLQNRGTILEIELQDTGAYEIWIRDIETQENFAYYLFPYDNGVIEVNE
jgi:hypothetical protein